MKSILFFLLGAILPLFSVAQLDRTANSAFYSAGLPVPSDIVGKRDLIGSEFLNDNWANAIVELKNNQVFKDIMVKYNVLDDVLYFQGEKEVAMKFVVPVAEFSLLADNSYKSARVFKSGFPKIDKFDGATFYQVLAEGEALLLKKEVKKIVENREYNSAITTKEIVNSIKYFLFYDGKITEVKKDKSFFINNLGKSKELDTFITDNKVNFKNEDHLVRLILYFNSLNK